ncbi:FAD-binding protein [Allorhizobium undicola]|uniref:FAD-binding protein n=1 Tax=Allorhizobium undicola TaxID=78527 RepID=UPI00048A24E7|nr:FAD-binding protein [Allorhizobium undicola]
MTAALLAPASEEEAARLVAECALRNTRLRLCGGGTRSGFGNRVNAEATLSSRGLSGIVAYDPAEMVLTAKAGTPMAEIEAAVAEAGQALAFEPPDHRALMATSGTPTIGGVFASNASGPRRLLAGAARDHLLGLRFVNGRGEIIKAGGRVMKNVTGLDLVKLLAGSFGTLGFLTEVTFKVMPRPRASACLVLSGLDDGAAARAMAAAMALPVEVNGAAHLPELVSPRLIAGRLPAGPATIFRLEGLPASVSERLEKLAWVLGRLGPVSRVEDGESASLWQAVGDVMPFADGTEKPVWRVSMAPMRGHELVAGLRLHAAIDAFYDWQGGLVWMRMEEEPEAGLIRAGLAALGGGHASLLRATSSIRNGLAAFQPETAGVALLSERLRRSLDPAGIFNPGLMHRPADRAEGA